jgi:hypothetical protein
VKLPSTKKCVLFSLSDARFLKTIRVLSLIAIDFEDNRSINKNNIPKISENKYQKFE